MEHLWDNVSSRVDEFFFQRHMEKYLSVAYRMKCLVDEYLSNHSYRFISEIHPEPEPDWPKVSIDVKISVATYDLVLKVWEEVCNFVYPLFERKDVCGVFLHFELLE